MNPTTATSPPGAIFYPESDGLPMADNTKQLRWIFMLWSNLTALYRDRPDVFVASNLLWYPVEGQVDISAAPDVFVAFGRPKGDRGSYMQWEEGGVPPTVAFEVLSPGNTSPEMDNKFIFYEEHGVEEYYIYDPDRNRLTIYVRNGAVLRRTRPENGFVSPRLGIRFDLSGPELTIFQPDGQPFLSVEETAADRESAKQEANRSRQQADEAHRQADEARQQADEARRQADEANRQADEARQQADEARRQADEANRRTSRVVELSRKARRGQASVEELRELDLLEEQSAPPPA